MAELEIILPNLPAPPLPPYVDLRTFDDMPLNVVRLLNADIVFETTGDEFKAAVLLWARAWHQVPASSLPNDDTKLAYMAGYGRDLKGWKKVKAGALRGFEHCSDGRLYHPVIADAALTSWEKKSAGKEGARARWERAKSLENHNTSDATPSDSQDSTHIIYGDGLPSALPPGKTMPRTEQNRTDKESSTRVVGDHPLGPKGFGEAYFGEIFDTRFWPAYPKRAGSNPKKPARQKFIAAVKRGEDPEAIIAGAAAYAADPNTKTGSPYVKTAEVWLNKECWKEYAAAADAPGPDQRPPGKVNGTPITIPIKVPGFGADTQLVMARGYLLDGDLTPDAKEVTNLRPKPKDQRRWYFKNPSTQELFPAPGQPGCPLSDEALKTVAHQFGIDWP